MTTPARILRYQAQEVDRFKRPPTERERLRNERILQITPHLIARNGLHNITFRNLAIALQMDPRTLRFHYADLDALVAEILRRHLIALIQHIGQIPWDAPECQAKRRAAYLAYTRSALGGLTPHHLILVQERHHLPPDEREGIEATRVQVGDLLAGPQAQLALRLLDSPTVLPNLIERALSPPAPEPASQPAQPVAAKPCPILQKPQRPQPERPQFSQRNTDQRNALIASSSLSTARAPPLHASA